MWGSELWDSGALEGRAPAKCMDVPVLLLVRGLRAFRSPKALISVFWGLNLSANLLLGPPVARGPGARRKFAAHDRGQTSSKHKDRSRMFSKCRHNSFDYFPHVRPQDPRNFTSKYWSIFLANRRVGAAHVRGQTSSKHKDRSRILRN